MSKVRINDLAREMEVKSKQILDVLGELGLGEGKTHSSSIEDYEAEKVRGQFQRNGGASSRGSAQSRAPQGLQPKVDLSHISKPGDALKAILAKKQEQEDAARRSQFPARSATPAAPQPVAAKPAPPTVAAAPPPAAARPEPRKIMPPVRQEPRILPPSAQPAIASRPPANPVVAKAPAGAPPLSTRPPVASPH